VASEVDIANLALSYLGDVANVSSISPPDGSAQAVYCSRFYPVARDALLELHDWNFASRRAALPLLGDATTQTGQWCNQWIYTYGVPAGMLCARKVIANTAPDDWSVPLPPSGCDFAAPGAAPAPGQGLYTPQKFIVETVDNGTLVIRTNMPDAALLYTVRITDPTKFSPLFSETLSYYLSSRLAGPILKGDVGRAVGKDLLGTAMALLARAATSDAKQRRVDIAQAVPWMVGR
jgi:hypothetical protein